MRTDSIGYAIWLDSFWNEALFRFSLCGAYETRHGWSMCGPHKAIFDR